MNKPTTLNTKHGKLKLPAFLPDATYGTVKHLSFEEVKQCGIEALVTTTLHIEQKLDSNYLAQHGGFHKFSGWDRPLLTDSGGFQVFSLIYRHQNPANKITDAGCSFIDPATGDYKFISPETSQIIQHRIGSDIRVVLDEPLLGDASLAAIKRSVKRTTEWAKRSKQMFLELNQLSEADFNNKEIKRPLLTAVVQGANNLEYRQKSAEQLMEIGFDIYGLGGMPLRTKRTWDYSDAGGFYEELMEMLAQTLPADKLLYALGVGTPDDLRFCIDKGWDIFDTVLPTRNGRHGYLYVSKGNGDTQYKSYDVLHIKNNRYANSEDAVDPECNCEACKTISRSFLRYLIKTNQALGKRLATIHNLTFYAKVIQNLQN